MERRMEIASQSYSTKNKIKCVRHVFLWIWYDDLNSNSDENVKKIFFILIIKLSKILLVLLNLLHLAEILRQTFLSILNFNFFLLVCIANWIWHIWISFYKERLEKISSQSIILLYHQDMKCRVTLMSMLYP